MLHFVTSSINQNKTQANSVENVQYGLGITFKLENVSDTMLFPGQEGQMGV